MKPPDESETWSAARLAALLAASNGVAPDPVAHVIFRAAEHADGSSQEGYEVAGEDQRLDHAGLDAWLAHRGLTGATSLAVAILVIREKLDERGLIVQCTLERRRGAVDGPYYGHPARVDFTGPADTVRLYRSHTDGRLEEIAPTGETAPPHPRASDQFSGEHKAIVARFGDTVRLLDAREPTLFEDMIGLSSITHVRSEDGREIGCGTSWHGRMAFVLVADFPRLGNGLALQPDDAEAVEAALHDNGLVGGDLRRDEQGVAVLARRNADGVLFLLRPRSGQVQLEAYSPGLAAAGPDQLRWVRYAETSELLTIADVWRDSNSSSVIVQTSDPSGQVWRHHIDLDGVETWRRPEAGTVLVTPLATGDAGEKQRDAGQQ